MEKFYSTVSIILGLFALIFLYTDHKVSMFLALGLALYSEVRVHLYKLERLIKQEKDGRKTD